MTTTHTSNRTIALNPVMVRRSGIHLLLLFIAGLLPASAATPPAGDDWLKADPAAVAHWQSLRFGMFIHWGPVSLTGNPLFPFSDRLPSVFSALGEKANS